MSDIRFNRTDLFKEGDFVWVRSRKDRRPQKTVTYKSDGMLFKEDWEAYLIDKKKEVKAHSHDDYIQNHKYPNSNHGSWWPWYTGFDIDNELTVSYTLNFQEDGTVSGIINTRYMYKNWEVIKKYKPQPLVKRPK